MNELKGEQKDWLVLHLGTNIGDRKKNISVAKKLLEDYFGGALLESSLYQTAAWGKEDQSFFLNQAFVFRAKKMASEILKIVQDIENEMGRVRNEKWGERLIDIDIMFKGAELVNTPVLIIPHPFIALRRFVLEPLVEIIPDWMHPIENKSILKMLEECRDDLEVKKISA